MGSHDERGTVWITGAGSGVGRATALLAADHGWSVALSGRREDALRDVAREVESRGGTARVVVLDVSRLDRVPAALADIEDVPGPVARLVVASGLNVPERYWRDQSVQRFSDVVATNLTGTAAVVSATLPGMRERGDGSIVIVSSYSGWRFSPDAGVAYSASKTALGSLVETLNAQENRNGVRACHLCPGDIDTGFLDLRPVIPDADQRRSMLSPGDVARTVWWALDAPAHVCINELVVTPTKAATSRPGVAT